MPKKKLVVDLKPIREQIKKAQQELRRLKPQVAVGARKTVALDIKKLDQVAKLVAKICRSTMTRAFDPGEDVE